MTAALGQRRISAGEREIVNETLPLNTPTRTQRRSLGSGIQDYSGALEIYSRS